MKSLIFLVNISVLLAECPHTRFVQQHICDYCKDWTQVVEHQISAGAEGITAVLGPPVHSFPPLFRQTGPHSNDFCINRQARPAYRCNMAASRPYCFKVANRCYGVHYPDSGQFYKAWDRRALLHCVDDYTWAGQHTHDDYSATNRRGDTRYD